LHLATYLHAVNLFTHDLVIMIYAYLHKKGISWTCPEWHNYIAWPLFNLVGYSAVTEGCGPQALQFLILFSKNEYVTKLNPEGLMELTEWEIIEDILHYDCIIPEILKIKFSSYMTIWDIMLLYKQIQ
jgi:hypothetical protein